MPWPFCTPPARKDCFPSEYRRTDERVPRIRCTGGRIGSEIRAQRKKDLRIETEDSKQSESRGNGNGGMLQSAVTMEEETMTEQSFENHGKFVPSYHFFAVPVFLINFLWSLYRLRRLGISFEGIFGVILAAALVVLVFEARLFALAVQDRVIRLEGGARYAQVLRADLQARTGALTINQIVAMRFASDAELPALVRKVLDEKLMERKAIKQLINNW